MGIVNKNRQFLLILYLKKNRVSGRNDRKLGYSSLKKSARTRDKRFAISRSEFSSIPSSNSILRFRENCILRTAKHHYRVARSRSKYTVSALSRCIPGGGGEMGKGEGDRRTAITAARARVAETRHRRVSVITAPRASLDSIYEQ